MTYQLTHLDSIKRLSDNAFIPPDPHNEAYQEYLSWLEDGNTPLPADPLPEFSELTPQQKLEQVGLSVEELKTLLGM